MSKPGISVIMPVYNSEKYLSGSIESILGQTFGDFEFIILDDGSEDSSVEIIKSFNDPRIRFFQNEKKGISEQLNFGIEKAEAELIARMDADDTCDKNRFQKQYDFLIANKNINLCATNFYLIDENSEIVNLKKFPEKHEDIEFMMPVLTSICHASMLVYKKDLAEAGRYKTITPLAEDQELFLRMISHGSRFYNLQEPLYHYRLPGKNISKERFKQVNESMYRNGSAYLSGKMIDGKPRTRDLFRKGLLEYYHGSISKARKIFRDVLDSEEGKEFKVRRYLLVTYAGDKIIRKLRETNVLGNLSSVINKFFKKDFHSIKTKN